MTYWTKFLNVLLVHTIPQFVDIIGWKLKVASNIYSCVLIYWTQLVHKYYRSDLMHKWDSSAYNDKYPYPSRSLVSISGYINASKFFPSRMVLQFRLSSQISFEAFFLLTFPSWSSEQQSRYQLSFLISTCEQLCKFLTFNQDKANTYTRLPCYQSLPLTVNSKGNL